MVGEIVSISSHPQCVKLLPICSFYLMTIMNFQAHSPEMKAKINTILSLKQSGGNSKDHTLWSIFFNEIIWSLRKMLFDIVLATLCSLFIDSKTHKVRKGNTLYLNLAHWHICVSWLEWNYVLGEERDWEIDPFPYVSTWSWGRYAGNTVW